MIKYLVILGAIVQLYGVATYIKETVKGNTKPNKVTWLMWSIAPMIATAAALSTGVQWATLPVFMSGFGPFLVFASSFINKQSYWKLKKFDYICGVCSLLALILWGVTRQPLVAIVFAIASDSFAALPTLIKSWRNPETETIDPYATGLFNAVTSFFALKTFAVAELAFPIYLLFVNSSLSITILLRRYLGRYSTPT